MTAHYLEKIKFLIVEDNGFMQRIVWQVLKVLGAEEIREASNGADGLKELLAYSADIAIVDWEMEPVNGIEFIKKVRTGEDSPNPFLPIIMLTAYSEMNRITEARDAGVNEFMVKPISARTLFDRIEMIIERPRPFVSLTDFFGPDRWRKATSFSGDNRRQGTKEMSQDEINVLINPSPEEAESTAIDKKSSNGDAAEAS